MKFRPLLVLLLALTVTCVSAQSAADMGAGTQNRKATVWPIKPTATEAQAAQLTARFLTRFHYDAQPLDDAMSQRIYTAYFKLLDSDRKRWRWWHYSLDARAGRSRGGPA